MKIKQNEKSIMMDSAIMIQRVTSSQSHTLSAISFTAVVVKERRMM